MDINLFDGTHKYYFVGIGGVSMSALAKIVLSMGNGVCGSDRVESEYTRDLTARGIQVDFTGDDCRLDDCDVVIYTDAVKPDDQHLRRAVADNKLIIPRGAFLAELCKKYKHTIAVAGCHGKTTCVSMLSHIFASADREFTAHIGGNDLAFGNCRITGYDFMLTEACEYNKNFLRLRPDISVILNTDADHLECYSGRDGLIEAYRQFSDSSKKCATLFGDGAVRGDITFGVDEEAYYRAKNISASGGKYSFELCEGGRLLCNVSLNVYGRHNILNALAAAAAARLAGIRPEAVEQGLARFSGVARRFEKIGTINGCEVIADYAHHPREMAAALRTAAEVTSGEIYVIFQPHTYSRTKNLFGDFVSVLSGVNKLLIYKTFAAREYFDAEGSALTLSSAIKNSRYAECERDIMYFLRDVRREDKVFVLGAGDICSIVKNMLV